MESKRTRLIDRYLELAAESPGNAEAYMSGLIKPRKGVQVNLIDEGTGESLNVVDTMDVLTQDVLGRGAAAGAGDRGFNKEVERQVKVLRRQAMESTLGEHNDPFTMEQVTKV